MKGWKGHSEEHKQAGSMGGKIRASIDLRKRVLESFLNSAVDTVRPGIYTWRGHYYEVLPYGQILKRGGWSQFVKRHRGKNLYGLRELTDAMLKKYQINEQS